MKKWAPHYSFFLTTGRSLFLSIVIVGVICNDRKGSIGNQASALSVTSSYSSSSSTNTGDPNVKNVPPPRAIRRVAIVGAGISGLSFAHALDAACNDPTMEGGLEVCLFDRRDDLFEKGGVGVGAGIQLNGGASIFHQISRTLGEEVAAAAMPLRTIRSQGRGRGRSGDGTTLLELDVAETFREAERSQARGLVVKGNVMSYTLLRGTLQEVLLRTLPASCTVSLGKALIGVEEAFVTDTESSSSSSSSRRVGGIVCRFADGTTSQPFDLVVGCDGVRSVVKDYVETGSVAAQPSSAIYSGLRVQFAVQDDVDVDVDVDVELRDGDGELRQYFGDGSYGLTGTYGAGFGRNPSRMAVLVYRDEDYIGPFRKMETSSKQSKPIDDLKDKQDDENIEWDPIQGRQTEHDPRMEMLRRMEESDMGFALKDIRPIVEASNRTFEVGVYFHNPLRFPTSWRSGRRATWSREVGRTGCFCVLVGDAAHALPPFLGQGANQAVQDAYCLAQTVREHNTRVSVSTKRNDDDDTRNDDEATLGLLLEAYERRRWQPTADLFLKSAFLGYLETAGGGVLTSFRDTFFTIMGKLGVAKKIYLDGATPKI